MDCIGKLAKKLEGLSGRKSDLESQVTNAERSGTKKRKMEVANWFEKVANIEDEFGALKTSIEQGCLLKNAFSGGDRVAEMDATVEGLIEESDHFGELCLEVFESRGKPRVTTKLFGEKFDRGLKDIWAWLDANEILRIGIWGMGGVGKTTLAEHIHNHLLKNPQSLRVYWVSVSQDFTIKRLQGDVAKRLGLDLSHEDDEKVRARKLRDAFEKMKEMVVLMLDDVWEEFRLNSLGIDARNCRLILTTRSEEVCNRMRCHRTFELKTLDTEEAWGLFERTLGSETLLDGDLKDIAKSVAKRCGGLPLGIVTVAGSMRGVKDICEWRNACSIGYHEMERDVFPILEWSFIRLNECQRNCFLYCCLYPEDWKIKRKELIDLFIWAELMSKRESWSKAFDEGQTILNKLIRVCLLEETTDFEGDDCVKMHDLVRDMAIRITHGNPKPESSRDDVPRFLVKSLGQEDSQATTLEQEEWTEDLRAVSFYSQNSKGIEIPPAWSPNCPKLSTLFLSRVSIREIPDSFFRHMCGLKVLRIMDLKFLWQLSSASPRDQLEVSSISPAGTFSSLKELSISKCHNMKQLFTVQLLQSLQNLEILTVEDCEGLEEIAADGNGVGQGGGEGTQLTSSEGATATVILPKLRRLRLDNLPQLKNICKAAMIYESIEEIAIFNCPNLKRLPSFLSTIDGPPYLLPAGTFSSLKELWISRCHNMKQLFTVQLLQSLQNLEELYVDYCEGLEEIAADGNGVGQGGGEGTQLTSSEGATGTVTLPKLWRLSLDNLPQLKSICKAAMICDSIYEIKIFSCPNLKRLPLFLSTIDGPPSLPSTLHKIRGDKELWESLEWDHSSAKKDLDPYFTTE